MKLNKYFKQTVIIAGFLFTSHFCQAQLEMGNVKQDEVNAESSNINAFFYGKQNSDVTLPYETDNEYMERMKEWKDAKYGLFLHFGLYSVWGGEYKGEMTPKLVEWMQNTMKIPLSEYKKLLKQFNPVKFNADTWARFAKDAGMKYVVLTSKHHDGFALWDSKASDYDVMATPFKKDIVKELKDACHKYGLKFGLYYSHNIDWEDPNNLVGGGKGNGGNSSAWTNTTDFDPLKMNKQVYLEKKAFPQLKELLTNYGKIDILWFDMGTGLSNTEVRQFVKIARELQPQILISSRVGGESGEKYLQRDMLFDFYTPDDNFFTGDTLAMPWEMVGTTNTSWGYRKGDNHWRSSKFILTSLLACASRNGNYMINVGPLPDGTFPNQSSALLQSVGKWLQKNGDAVYGADKSPFPWNYDWGFVTQKPGKLFLSVMEWPTKEKLHLNGLLSQVKKVYLLDGGKELKYEQKGRFLTIDVAGINPDSLATAIVVEYNGKLETTAVIAQGTANNISLDRIAGSYDQLHKLTTWKFEIQNPGIFKVQIISNEKGRHDSPEWIGSEQAGAIQSAGQIIPIKLKRDNEIIDPSLFFYKRITSNIGELKFDKPGKYSLQLKDFEIDARKYGKGLGLQKIELIRE
jgi:alpha-L-fucosidase